MVSTTFKLTSQSELIGWESIRRAFVRLFILSNMNTSATSGEVYIFCADQSKTLVSMPTDSSNGVIMGEMLATL